MGKVWEVCFYATARGRIPVQEAIEELTTGHQQKAAAWLRMLAEHGPRLPRPYADHLRGRIRELRIGFGGLEFRILYAFVRLNRALLLHGFAKKGRAVPPDAIQTAEERLADFENRFSRREIRP